MTCIFQGFCCIYKLIFAKVHTPTSLKTLSLNKTFFSYSSSKLLEEGYGEHGACTHYKYA